MAGPVFVIDAQGQPLMPLAAAHARRLLTSGKAQLRPHYLHTIVQLHRVVAQPVLRPILVGIDIHRSTAELRVLADGPRACFPLLSLVVDFVRVSHYQYRYAPRQRQQTRGPSWRIRTIGAIIASLSPLLPISHIVMLRSSALQSGPAGWLRWLRRSLTGAGVEIRLARSDAVVPLGIPADLYAALNDFRHKPPHHIPVLVALLIGPPPRGIRLRGSLDESVVDSSYSGIGVVAASPLIGLIKSSGETLVLRVPVAVDRTGVTWRYVAVPPRATLQHWRLSPVAILPLLPDALRDQMTLYEYRQHVIHICRAHGLTGAQGVLIPRSNVRHLMLREDVVDAVRAGQFHIWAVTTIDEGIEILTGVPAGARRFDGCYPEGSLNARVERRLHEFTACLSLSGETNGMKPALVH